MSTGVEVEGGVAGGELYRVVISELDRGEIEVPVRVPGIDVGSEGLLDDPVDALGLTVGLGMEGGRKGEFGTKEPEKGTPEVRSEPRISVRDNDARQALMTENIIKIYSGDGRGSGIVRDGCDFYFLR